MRPVRLRRVRPGRGGSRHGLAPITLCPPGGRALAVQRAARIEAQRRAKREVETPAEAEVGISGKITPLTARVSDGG
jgi:hypothetical protein